jgi:hypothetical protein
MPSTDTKPELTAKASIAQPVSQPAVYANGLIYKTVDNRIQGHFRRVLKIQIQNRATVIFTAVYYKISRFINQKPNFNVNLSRQKHILLSHFTFV